MRYERNRDLLLYRHHHVTKRTLAAILNWSSVILIRLLMVVQVPRLVRSRQLSGELFSINSAAEIEYFAAMQYF